MNETHKKPMVPIVLKFFEFNLDDALKEAVEYASRNKLRIISLSHNKEEDGYYVVVVCEDYYD